ncbi:hypothetical protein VMCG_07713 [Cytospora schulzeri]|uniref:Extracellular membrane protein CFEM domain-containing protein n=1 Tax=Cytospora schulzeri TaxID=448051 RepID=A0A423VYV7_9PEZI|nr:hypothetical protein VMCG_07713 [Valsa malicola]
MEAAKRTGLLLLWAFTTPALAAKATTTTSASSSSSTSYPFDLGSDVTDFIPSCALSCFESFLAVNYNGTTCGSSPSLQCLSDIVSDAYDMCKNEPDAAPETHATIIATLIVPPTGAVTFPEPSTTAATTTTSSSRSWTTSYMTPTMTVASKTSSEASSSSSSSSSSTTTAAAAASGTGTPTSSKLTGAQIGGIAGGFAAAVLLASLALFLFLRKRRGQPLTGFYRMKDSLSPRRDHGPSPKISAPQYQEPKSMSFTRALAQRFSRTMTRPDTIGLAISPEGGGMQGAAVRPGESLVAAAIPPAAAAGARWHSPSPPPIPPLSPLRTQANFNFLPPQGQQQLHSQEQHKPILSLAIPPPKTSHYNENRSSTTSNNNRMPFGGGRDSVVTEFAEDGETSAGPGSAQIWRPPVTDPKSATTYYIADKWGNWVLGEPGTAAPDEQIAELPTPASKTVEERRVERQERAVPESSAVRAAVKDLSSPKMPSAAVAVGGSGLHKGRGRSTIRQVAPDSGRLPVNSRSSSVYSTFSTNFSMPQTVQPGPENPMPTTANAAAARMKAPSQTPESYYTGAGGGKPAPSRDLTSRPRGGSGGGSGGTRDRTNTMLSQDSSTTIASSIESEVGVDSFPMPSRQSTAPDQQREQGSLSPVFESPGRSPVSYPKIPRLHNVPGINNDNSYNYNKDTPGSQDTKPLQNPRLRVVNSSEPRDSPTLGVVDSQKPVQMGTVRAAAPVQAHISYYDPAKRQSVNPNPNRNPGQVRSGSPDGMGGTSPSLGRTSQTQQQQPAYGPARPALRSFQQRIDNDRSRLPSQSHYGPMSIYDAYARPESNYPQEPAWSSQQQQQYQPQHQKQYHPYQPQQRQQPQPPQQQQYYPYRHHLQQQHYPITPAPSPLSASDSPSVSASVSASNSSSSLLAKRLGAERAAAFQVNAPVENTYNSSQARWKRRQSSLGGPDARMRPDAGAGGMMMPGAVTPTPKALVVRKKGAVGGAGGGGGTNGMGDGNRDGEQEWDVPLPATPGWKPQLTPQRRGGDLYLRVQ